MEITVPKSDEILVKGFCTTCKREHALPVGNAVKYAMLLMEELEIKKRIDIDVSLEKSQPIFSTSVLWGEERGQMFGILVCENGEGEEVVLKAFSCQHNGEWSCTGWAPPLVDPEAYLSRCREVGSDIKKLTKELQCSSLSQSETESLKARRKEMSQKLMKELHGYYALHNFKGEIATLEEAFAYDKGIPSGTGDCCAPKLLNQAACLGLKPTGIVEFYWGRENRSGDKQHKQFYPSCDTKCGPILGFLLCGAHSDE